MKKFFMADTDEELQFGDMIVLDLTKEVKNGKMLHKHMECKFSPFIVDTLLEQGVIKMKEVKDDDLIDFEDTEEDETIEEILESQEELEKRMDTLEETVKTMAEDISGCLEEIKKIINEDKQKKTKIK